MSGRNKASMWMLFGPGATRWLQHDVASADVPSAEWKDIIAEAAERTQSRRPRPRRVVIGVMQLLVLVLVPAVVVSVMLAVTRSLLMATAAFLVALIACVLLMSVRMPESFARDLREVLRERGYDVCMNCGYSLQALGEEITRCPECGAERTPLPSKA